MLDDLIRALPAPHANTGLVVGVAQHGQFSVFGYGQASDARPEPPRGDTLFEIGSISKVFTTSLLAIALADGRLRLEDAVCGLVPQLAHWPSDLTLLSLATHTSGLPKMPSNLIRSMLRDRRNPYAAYTHADLLGYLARYKPRGRRPAPANYSNLGLALLGFIVAQQLGGAYEAVVVERLCAPLGLSDTRITLTADQQKRLAAPHTANGKPGHTWDLPTFAGAGALRSTANDLLKFLAANTGRPQSTVTDALPACHKTYTDVFAPAGRLQNLLSGLAQTEQTPAAYRQGMALGWSVGRLHSGETQVHWHHGATGAYRAFAGFTKSTDIGVVVLANSGLGLADALSNSTTTDAIGFKVLEHLNS